MVITLPAWLKTLEKVSFSILARFIFPNPVITLNTITDFLSLPNCCRRQSHPARLNMASGESLFGGFFVFFFGLRMWIKHVRRRLITAHGCNPVAGNLRGRPLQYCPFMRQTVLHPGTRIDPIWCDLQASSGCRQSVPGPGHLTGRCWGRH